jgi:hypothetical protein
MEYYDVSRKVATSNPCEVIGFLLNLLNPSSRTMIQALTQPLTEMNTGIFAGGKLRTEPKAYNLIVTGEPNV